MKSCKTCQHLDVKPDARGRIVVRQYLVFPCLAPQPELPALPACITKACNFRWPPPRNYMQGNDGVNCPTWLARQQKEKTT